VEGTLDTTAPAPDLSISGQGAPEAELAGKAPRLTRSPELSVIVPAYRDRGRIVPSLRRLEAALDSTGLSWEVVLVVDGDAETREHAEACRSERVHVHAYSVNRGKGFALRIGMLHAGGELVTLLDSDMEIAPEEIGRMATLLRLYDADIVVGSKRHPLSLVHYPRFRRFQSWCYQRLVHLLFRIRVSDTQTGLKMMRREVAQRVLGLAVVKRFAFDLELIALARRFGFPRIIEAPVIIDYKFSSTTNLRAVFNVLWDTAAIFYRMRIKHWYDRRAAQSSLVWTDPDVVVVSD
jgi:glycosyltransferase involved in cell wall biosynthesis